MSHSLSRGILTAAWTYHSHSHFEVHLLWCSCIDGPRSLQGCACYVIDLSMATGSLKCSSTASCTSLKFHGVSAATLAYPWATRPSELYLLQYRKTTATIFRGVPVLVWIHPWPQVLQGLLLPCGLVHGSL